MRKRTALQEYLLSAAIMAAPAACLAAEPPAPVLKPVSDHSALLQVPESEATGVMHAQFAPAGKERSISLTQHQSDTSGNSSNRQESKKPGFFKRLYKRFTVSEDESRKANANSGQAAVPIPQPPPIDFTIRDKNGTPKNQAQVPTQTIGYGSSKASVYQSANAGSAQPLVPNHQLYQEPTVRNYSAPSTGPVKRQDDFINPFESTDTVESDALLDLDSLIGSGPLTAPGARATVVPRSKPKQIAVPETDLSVERKPMKVMGARRPATQKKTTSGPFSGYRLPSDDEVLGLPDPEPEPKIESVPVITPEEIAPVKVEKKTVVRIPLLEEPEMALPTVTEAPEEAEPMVLDLAPVEPPKQPILIDPEPAFEPAVELPPEPKIVPPRYIETPAQPSAQTLKALDGRARREQQRYRIMARTGKLGFKGFCPVALRNERDLVDSREQFKAKFGLQTYYFSSAEAKAAFDADPARYAPAGGGSDVVLLVNTGEEVPGSLDFSLWYRDRLYMFRSRETQAMFSKNPRRFADEY